MRLQRSTFLGRDHLMLALAWSLLLALAWLAYLPGLSGGFLFDDFVNLPAIGASGPIDNAAAFWRYLTSGTSDPSGRPLALLSFLLDARGWPADPAPFLRTNLYLHLINGSLLLVLLRKLGRFQGGDDSRNDAAALLGAGLWLLHPLFVSTTLYIVQREAMLPATFVLLGLLAFSHGRSRYQQTQGSAGLAWMIGGIVVGTGLAILCKANGILLPLLAAILQFTVFQPRSGAAFEPAAQRKLNRFDALFLLLPSGLLLAFLVKHLLRWSQPISLRPWTIGERALTEARVLVDYLNLLIVPRSVSTGLYNDDYVISHGLWTPSGTLPAIWLLLGLFALGIYWRRRKPDWSAAILFFFAGHALESTVLPLELYFEHRNYLPALLLFWPVSRALANANFRRNLRWAAGGGLLLLFALTTFQRANIWGHPDQLATLWAARNPTSSRAQATAAISDIERGHPERALQRLGPLWQRQPDDLQISLNYINAACTLHGISPDDTVRLAGALRHAKKNTLLVRSWLENALYAADAGRCPGLTLATVEAWLAAAQENPAINTRSASEKSIPSLLALLALKKHQPDLALTYFNRALAANVSPDVAAGQVAILASDGYYAHALRHLDYYEHLPKPEQPLAFDMAYVHARVLARQGYWPRELAILRGKLQDEIAAEQHGVGQPDKNGSH